MAIYLQLEEGDHSNNEHDQPFPIGLNWKNSQYKKQTMGAIELLGFPFLLIKKREIYCIK